MLDFESLLRYWQLVIASVFLMSEFSPTSFIERNFSTFSGQGTPCTDDSKTTVTDLEAELCPNKAAFPKVPDCAAHTPN